MARAIIYYGTKQPILVTPVTRPHGPLPFRRTVDDLVEHRPHHGQTGGQDPQTPAGHRPHGGLGVPPQDITRIGIHARLVDIHDAEDGNPDDEEAEEEHDRNLHLPADRRLHPPDKGHRDDEEEDVTEYIDAVANGKDLREAYTVSPDGHVPVGRDRGAGEEGCKDGHESVARHKYPRGDTYPFEDIARCTWTKYAIVQ